MTISCYTDGAALSNGKKNCRGGLGVVFPDRTELNLSESLPANPVPTNNRAELSGIIRAIQQCDVIDPSKTTPLAIKSDSQLCVSTCNTWLGGWKRKGWRKSDKSALKNLDLLQQLDTLMAARKVTLIHVRAHTGGVDDDSRYNALADKLASEGCLHSYVCTANV